MASTGVNVFRWSALGLGVLYGIYHQSSLTSRDKLNARKAEYHHKESLISQAKAEFARQNPSQSSQASSSSATKAPIDPMNDVSWLDDEK